MTTPARALADEIAVFREKLAFAEDHQLPGRRAFQGQCLAEVVTRNIDLIVAALHAYDGGWQPIGTAPKDGTWFLGWADNDLLPYRISWARNHRGEMAWCTSFCSLVDGYLTHWRPLSPAPAPVEG